MKRSLSCFALMAALTSGPISAATTHFLFPIIASPSSAFNMDLPTQPTVSSFVPGVSFTLDDVTVCQAYFGCLDPFTADLTFYTAANDGGLFTTGGGYQAVRYQGDALFSGSVDHPTFLPGIFAVRDDQIGNTELVEITSVTAAPEPSTWGMMILGFGLAGARLRPRRREKAGTVKLA